MNIINKQTHVKKDDNYKTMFFVTLTFMTLKREIINISEKDRFNHFNKTATVFWYGSIRHLLPDYDKP